LTPQPYHPDDLKGKGEPSYTYERDKAKNKGLQRGEYEMQSGVNGDGVLGPAGIYGPGPASSSRPRSVSNVDKATTSATAYRTDEPSEYLSPGGPSSSSGGVRRSNTTGKKLSDGLKKRFGSIRKRKDATTVE
jgi:hypothetical protein